MGTWGGKEEPWRGALGGEEVSWRGTPGVVAAEETGEGARGNSENLGGRRLAIGDIYIVWMW